MRLTLTLATALLLAVAGRAAAETDVENPGMRELPLRQSPIIGGKQHQPTQSEVSERIQAQNRDTAGRPQRKTPDLYDRVLQQSQKPKPRTLESQ